MVELEINSLVYGGAGLAKLDGKAVFIEDTVDGDVVEAEIYSDKKKFANAKLVKINKPSKYRVEPFCKLAKVCGGCQWQHVDYSHQLEVKARIVKETLEKALKRISMFFRLLQAPITRNIAAKFSFRLGKPKIQKDFYRVITKKTRMSLLTLSFARYNPL
jgi:23S rRNA (uracil1939-C5)-methyltransferase